jgi:hypothetical protein
MTLKEAAKRSTPYCPPEKHLFTHIYTDFET